MNLQCVKTAQTPKTAIAWDTFDQIILQMAKDREYLFDHPSIQLSVTYSAVVNNGISVGISCNCSPRQMTVVPSHVQPFGHWTPHWALRAVWSYSIRSKRRKGRIKCDVRKDASVYFDIEIVGRLKHRTFVWPFVEVRHIELHLFQSASHVDRHSTSADGNRRWTDSVQDVCKTKWTHSSILDESSTYSVWILFNGVKVSFASVFSWLSYSDRRLSFSNPRKVSPRTQTILLALSSLCARRRETIFTTGSYFLLDKAAQQRLQRTPSDDGSYAYSQELQMREFVMKDAIW